MRLIVLFSLLLLSACAGQGVKPQSSETAPETVVARPVSFSALPGWKNDDLKGFVTAFTRSCGRIVKAPADKPFGALAEAGTYGAWQPICRDFTALGEQDGQGADSGAIRAFLESRFQPYEIRNTETAEGLFTGYYEASLKGSRVKTSQYAVPLYARPGDLVMVDLGEFRPEFKGQRIAGRVVEGALKPYETRESIVKGAWPHNDGVLVWVDDAVAAFFVQIQGSGIVELEDGGVMRIGYAAQNGHPYTAIGRELIARGEMTKENVSMRSIQDWLERHPDEADTVMNLNKSYVFFKEADTSASGPTGAENLPLTAGRSVAVDRSLLAYGLPLWVDIKGMDIETPHLQRLMVAQDTGGAIRGAVRADVFWGYGAEAEALAGPMKSPGRYWALLPK